MDTIISNEGDDSDESSDSQSNSIEPSSRKSNSISRIYWSNESKGKSVIKYESQNVREESKMIENNENYCKSELYAQSRKNEIFKYGNRKRKNKKLEDYQSREDQSFNSEKIRSSEVFRKNLSYIIEK